MARLATILMFVAAISCKKESAETKPASTKEAPVSAGTVQNGVRKIDIEANKDGYTPDKIAGKPGEKLDLVFKRTFEADCISQLKTPDGKLVDLPMNKPVDVEVTVPEKGELTFACGMDMFHGTIIAQPNG
jgi:plastocyanin domain-containing protein